LDKKVAKFYFMKKQEKEEKENAVKEAESTRSLIELAMREKGKLEEKEGQEQQKNAIAGKDIESLEQMFESSLKEIESLRIRLTQEQEEYARSKEKVSKLYFLKKQDEKEKENAQKEAESARSLMEQAMREKGKAEETALQLFSLEEERQKKARADEDIPKLKAWTNAQNLRADPRFASKVQKQLFEGKENALKRRMKEVSEKNKQATEKKEEMKKQQLKYPPPAYWNWKGFQRLPKGKIFERIAAPRDSDWIRGLLTETMLHIDGCKPASNRGSCFLRKMKSVVVWRIENPFLWNSYAQKKQEMIRINESDKVATPPLSLQENGPFQHEIIDEKVNEVRLWHGTKRITNTTRPVDAIIEGGFDERVANRGLYGEGMYFASQSCKAAQYCHDQLSAHDDTYRLFYCRVLLGHAYAAQGDMVGVKRPPARHEKLAWPLHDSVIAKQGTPNSRGNQAHEEFIVYDRRQVYPEYEVQIMC